MEREYVVTLHKYEDLNDFYNDMETPGGNLYIPNRSVDLFLRRTLSRNTHYMLTEEEAKQLKKDPRVKNVALSVREKNIQFIANFEQTSNFWNKSSFIDESYLSWGLMRTYLGYQPTNWGFNAANNYSGSVITNEEGRNVDVVIADGHFDPNHPEFAANTDGTGGSRVIRYNWFQLNSVLGLGANSNYNYDAPVLDTATNHGAAAAGLAVGSKYGWARKANIYNIWPYSTSYGNTTLNITSDTMLDYIRYWHNNKPINPVTGVKNPTVMNNSWGSFYRFYLADFEAGNYSIRYRGIRYSGTFSKTDLLSFGIFTNTADEIIVGAEDDDLINDSISEDIIDAVNDGVILVVAAGNSSFKIDVPGGIDYDNAIIQTFIISGQQYDFYYYYNRGSKPYLNNYTINVGAVGDDIVDSKATYSCSGPGVNIWAPGTRLMTSYQTAGISDPRNSNYKLAKPSGTSFAAPIVTGIIACILETYPRMSFSEIKNYIENTAKLDQITSQGNGMQFNSSLQGSPNRMVYFNRERFYQGEIYPKKNFKLRPESGQIYPRSRIYRTTK